MNGHILRNVIVVVLGLLLIGAVWAGLKMHNEARLDATASPTDPLATTTGAYPVPSDVAPTTKVKVALLDYTGEMPGKSRGCDHVILVDRVVPQTTAPLNAALRELFAIPESEVDGLGNFIPRTASTLRFDSATIQDGVARVYLSGSLSGLAGVCDDPRAKIQIEETALQFPTVQSVVLYLNGQETALQPSEQ